MSLVYVANLLANPPSGWARIHADNRSVPRVFFTHTMLFALVPAVCGYIGTTRTGWQVGAGNLIKLTEGSAALMACAYYAAMLVGALSVGWVIRWMSRTYGVDQPAGQCLALASFSATPLFLVGAVQLYPVLWLNLVAGLPALALTTYLFYRGVPVMMEVTRDRGFLFATAVMGFGLVALVAMLAVTVLLWASGFAPQFTH